MELEMPPDCVEFNGEVYGLGMYYLDGDHRSGGLVTLDKDSLQVRMMMKQDYGILDLRSLGGDKWVCACSDGSVKIVDGAKGLVDDSVRVASESSGIIEQVIMGLDGHGDSWASISTRGELAWFSLTEERCQLRRKIQAHSSSFESWAVGLHAGKGLTVTGSDDCRMYLWATDTGERVHADLKEHSMGVTSFRFEGDHKLISGSYDENLRVWDLRNLAKPTHTVKVGGGVWRIKQLAESKQYLIAACYGGAEVWDSHLTERVCHFDEHKSMVYGITTDQIGSIVTCSFYDKMVSRWSHDRIRYS
jgi:WD40 repeat protein